MFRYPNLPNRRRHKQSDEYEATDHNKVIRRHLEDVLQEECVQLGDLPEDHQLNDGGESHRRGLGIQPADG